MTLDEVRSHVERLAGARLARALDTLRFVSLVRDPETGEREALVDTDSRVAPYRVTAHGCECKGFTFNHYCKHYDAVMLAAARHAEGTAAPAAASLPVTVTVTVAAVTATVNDDLFPGTEPVAANAPVAIPPVTPTGRNRFFPTLLTESEREWRLTGRHTA